MTELEWERLEALVRAVFREELLRVREEGFLATTPMVRPASISEQARKIHEEVMAKRAARKGRKEKEGE